MARVGGDDFLSITACLMPRQTLRLSLDNTIQRRIQIKPTTHCFTCYCYCSCYCYEQGCGEYGRGNRVVKHWSKPQGAAAAAVAGVAHTSVCRTGWARLSVLDSVSVSVSDSIAQTRRDSPPFLLRLPPVTNATDGHLGGSCYCYCYCHCHCHCLCHCHCRRRRRHRRRCCSYFDGYGCRCCCWRQRLR